MKKLLLFILFFFLFSIPTFAETTGTYSSLKFEVQQCTVNGLIWGTCQNDSRNGIGSNNSINFGSDNGHLKKIQMQLFGGSNITYPMGNYNITVRIAKDPLILDEIRNVYQIKIFGNTSSSSNGADSSQNTISSRSCELEQVSQYVFDVKCLFSTNKNLKYIMISLEADELVPDNTDVIYWYSIPQFTYTTDSTGAINNQTNIIQNQFNQTNQNINNLNDSINSDTVDNPASDISSFNNSIASNGVITSLITLPITLFQSVINNINGTCSSFNLGSLYGTNLILPCIEVSDFIGSNLYSILDILFSGFFIYKIARKMIKVFNNFSSLKEGDVLSND